jgi:hypothetical protein
MEPTTPTNQTVEQQRYEQLQWSGWSAAGIKRLQLFRRTYVLTSLDFSEIEVKRCLRRLEFVRWLVLTGKLSDWK